MEVCSRQGLNIPPSRVHMNFDISHDLRSITGTMDCGQAASEDSLVSLCKANRQTEGRAGGGAQESERI